MEYKYPEFDIINFSDELYNLFNTLSTDNTIFLCGYFNIDILKLTCQKFYHFIDIFISLGLLPIITKPSCITNITSILIDNIYTVYNHIHDTYQYLIVYYIMILETTYPFFEFINKINLTILLKK